MTSEPHNLSIPPVTRDEAVASLAAEQANGFTIPVAVGPHAAFTIIQVCQKISNWRISDRAPLSFTDEEQEAMFRIGQQLSIAFENSNLAEEIRTGWE